MPQKKIKVRIYRSAPSGGGSHYQTYDVPIVTGMSALDVLDYIYTNLDSTIAYYSHSACRRGVCSRCTLLINGKPSLACQTAIMEDVTIGPLPKFKIIRDLVYSFA